MRAMRPCSRPGCPNLSRQGRCEACRGEAEAQRGTARQRGYDTLHERFRRQVLHRDPLCTCTTPGHGHHGTCLIPSTVADHHPTSRRDLVAMGLDPNDPTRGRGLCKGCHDRETARLQPGGWHYAQ